MNKQEINFVFGRVGPLMQANFHNHPIFSRQTKNLIYVMKKQIGYIDICPSLTWEPNEKYEYNIFYDVYNELSYGQAKFILTPESVEDFLKVLSYLTSKGWFNKIIMRYQFHGPNHNTFWMWCRKKRKVYDKEPTAYDLDRDGRLEVWVIVDKKRLNEFRELLKNIPDFKVTWLDLNNEIDILK